NCWSPSTVRGGGCAPPPLDPARFGLATQPMTRWQTATGPPSEASASRGLPPRPARTRLPPTRPVALDATYRIVTRWRRRAEDREGHRPAGEDGADLRHHGRRCRSNHSRPATRSVAGSRGGAPARQEKAA